MPLPKCSNHVVQVTWLRHALQDEEGRTCEANQKLVFHGHACKNRLIQWTLVQSSPPGRRDVLPPTPSVPSASFKNSRLPKGTVKELLDTSTQKHRRHIHPCSFFFSSVMNLYTFLLHGNVLAVLSCIDGLQTVLQKLYRNFFI